MACTSFREPALLAKMADTLDEVSGGRLLLGLGAGYHVPEYTAFGYPHDHLAGRFEEALQIILPLLKGERVTFHGKYYNVDDCVLVPHGPRPGGPPIWIGARQPRMLRLVAQYADAYNTMAHAVPETANEQFGQLDEACEEVGRNPDYDHEDDRVVRRLPRCRGRPGRRQPELDRRDAGAGRGEPAQAPHRGRRRCTPTCSPARGA